MPLLLQHPLYHYRLRMQDGSRRLGARTSVQAVQAVWTTLPQRRAVSAPVCAPPLPLRRQGQSFAGIAQRQTAPSSLSLFGGGASSYSTSPGSAFSADSSSPKTYELHALFASPLGQASLNISDEVQLITQAIADSQANVQLNVGVATVPSLSKFLTLARTRRRLMLHLSAHTTGEDKRLGLVLEDHRGNPHVLSRENLEDILSTHEEALQNISLLFLSACRSEALAQLFVEYGVCHVICVHARVLDSAARCFAEHFYLALAVGKSLRAAFEGARSALRHHPNSDFAQFAEHFTFYGQHGAEKETLDTMCIASSSVSLRSTPMDSLSLGAAFPDQRSPLSRDFESAEKLLAMKLPPRVDPFLGRSHAIAHILENFAATNGRRVCVIHGPAGIGKTSLGIEVARFAAMPGRLFSCGVMFVRIDTADALRLCETIYQQLEQLVERVVPSARFGYGVGGGGAAGALSSRSLSSAISASSLGTSYLGEEQQQCPAYTLPGRIRHLLHLLKSRRSSNRSLLVLVDEVGLVSSSSDVRQMLGELLEQADLLSILVCSRAPIYPSMSHKLCDARVMNFELPGLSPLDSANLFLQRIHRRLAPEDFPGTAAGATISALPPVTQQKEWAVRQLIGPPCHPLLQRLRGNPGHISAVAAQVTPGGPTLLDLAAKDDLLPVAEPITVAGSQRPAPSPTCGGDLLSSFVAKDQPTVEGSYPSLVSRGLGPVALQSCA
eukprot:CAMPEP_0178376658 /NCGR_PEP_ID=MMETSP0689_2-20121128/3515_1 /TAXON_ID=160604 /ORGANISM="Amphidinium massartii, Strain CS-259" /LENGTH=723 /DNA_ID=CAMNT_0019996685 /DNA_START=185 /DNA_END=2355 /DNA_ORIENTATION=-